MLGGLCGESRSGRVCLEDFVGRAEVVVGFEGGMCFSEVRLVTGEVQRSLTRLHMACMSMGLDDQMRRNYKKSELLL